ncbi:hypothetical protein SAMN05421813_10924 [Daejeonella rubra]|uniref:Uncharacterized protein n=1 Tax=Daejeonella rubra TaxID=990371 RepID=A0A1G9S104_9SPHI|nr:hypothetical protein [Daejeonella rubra]SDM29094.1 hypothetical protein SAMN05421813_10924 [Daejeonella rubra]
MVTVVDCSVRQSGEGKELAYLVVQGQPEFVKSLNSQRVYMTTRRAFVLTTFDKKTCKSLIGTKFPGSIKRIQCDEYEYTVPNSNEVIKLDFRYEYSDEAASMEEMVFESPN